MPDFYGSNELTNAGAETGNTTGWTASDASAVSGGATGSYCFQVNKSGTLTQSVSPSSLTDMRITCSFLPEQILDPLFPPVARVKATINYSDGTKDEIIIPCQVVQ
jgi:hypothetical protein